MTATTKVANEYGCSTCYSRNVPSRFYRRLKLSRDGNVEDVKTGVIFASAPPQVQNHCHLNSHILRSYAQVRTILFDYCRAQADTAAGDAVPMDLSMLGKGGKGMIGKGDKKGKGKGQRQERRRQQGRKSQRQERQRQR